MSYQNPAFMVAHPMASRSISDISARNSGSFTNDSKRALIDSRQGEVAEFTATAANAGFALNFGSISGSGTVNRCVIPAGHNFGGETLEVISYNSGVALPSPTVRSTGAVGASELVDRSFADVIGDRYWGLQISTSLAETFSLTEFWLGNRMELSQGDARIDQGFEREYEHDLAEDNFGGRTTSLELSPARRKFSLRIRDLDPSGADFAALENVIRDGRSKPFWYWTPDSTDTGPYLVKLTRAARRKQSSKVPTTFSRYEMDIDMLEQVT